MISINIKTISHNKQRYETVGDWFRNRDGLQIRVSRMGNERYEFLVALHELVEAFICGYTGVRQKAVDDFDIAYEKARHPGDESEPGDSPAAPYRFAHCIATGVERVVAAVIGVGWSEYEKAINAL